MRGVDTEDKEEDDGNDEEWREVGPRGTKSCVTRRIEKIENGNCAKTQKTPAHRFFILLYLFRNFLLYFTKV